MNNIIQNIQLLANSKGLDYKKTIDIIKSAIIYVINLNNIDNTLKHDDIEINDDKVSIINNNEVSNFDINNFDRLQIYKFKQYIKDSLDNIESNKVIENYTLYVNKLITCKIEYPLRDGYISKIDNMEYYINANSFSQNEKFMYNTNYKFLLLKVYISKNIPIFVLDRKSNLFLQRILEYFIPEIQNNRITVEKICRIPGVKSLVSVKNNTSNTTVDPVGACIGIKANRILCINTELNNERVDFITHGTTIEDYVYRQIGQDVNIIRNENDIYIVTKKQDDFAKIYGKKMSNIKLISSMFEHNTFVVFEYILNKTRSIILSYLKEYNINEQLIKFVINKIYVRSHIIDIFHKYLDDQIDSDTLTKIQNNIEDLYNQLSSIPNVHNITIDETN